MKAQLSFSDHLLFTIFETFLIFKFKIICEPHKTCDVRNLNTHLCNFLEQDLALLVRIIWRPTETLDCIASFLLYQKCEKKGQKKDRYIIEPPIEEPKGGLTFNPCHLVVGLLIFLL